MTLPYDRKFNVGRQSEQLFNEELHKLFEALKHIIDTPVDDLSVPEAKLHGSIWLDQRKNELNYFNKPLNRWENIFANKFRIIDELLSQLQPTEPVMGQLWIYNGVLLYFNGSSWEPIKALLQDGSQFDMSAFKDFSLISPLNKVGNTVVDDETNESGNNTIDIKLDAEANSQFAADGTEWEPFWDSPVNEAQAIEDISPVGMTQFLVPNIDLDKLFIKDKLVNDYTEISKVCVQYPKQYVYDKTVSLVHINPGKIAAIKKRFIKVDKLNPTIDASAQDTEFYGFRKNEVMGRLLLPSTNQDEGDYMTVVDSIVLNYSAAQNYDYILAVTYDFSWIKSTGRLTKSSNKDLTSSFYIANFLAPLNVFVEGYDLENKCYDVNSSNKVVNINEDVEKLEVSIMSSVKKEHGYIREVDLNGNGIIKLLNKFEAPLVFVNGELMHPVLGDLQINKDRILVPKAKKNMPWCVVEQYNENQPYDMRFESGVVTETDDNEEAYIEYDTTQIDEGDNIILFVDGLLVKREDVVKDSLNGTIKAQGLMAGQEYVLLKDKYNFLYPESQLTPAFTIGKLDESMVYLNGYLLCNDAAVVTIAPKAFEALTASNGEIKFFLASEVDRYVGEWCVYDKYNSEWKTIEETEQQLIKDIVYSYENTVSAIKVNIPVTKEDEIITYSYNFANTIDSPLYIPTEKVVVEEDGKTVITDKVFIVGSNSLTVFVNGIRQSNKKDYDELAEGNGFKFISDSVDYDTCNITYIIENIGEVASRTTCNVIDLEDKDMISPNVYQTSEDFSLYPGRVTVYVDGVRMPKEAWSILDNHTIMFKDKTQMLIGNSSNYPIETFVKADSSMFEIEHKQPDRITIEVRQEFERTEQTIVWDTNIDSRDLDIYKYELPMSILEASDEILIFVNGVFTGLTNEIGYKKDRIKGCISIINGDVINALSSDPLLMFFETHQDAYTRWKNCTGNNAYTPVFKNEITLEWR